MEWIEEEAEEFDRIIEENKQKCEILETEKGVYKGEENYYSKLSTV